MERRREFDKSVANSESGSVKEGKENDRPVSVLVHPHLQDDARPSTVVRPPYLQNISICLRLSPYLLSSRVHVERHSTRYLLCPSELTVAHLKKFIANRFNVLPDLQIQVFYSSEFFDDHYTLVDICVLHCWRMMSPLTLHYVIYDDESMQRRCAQNALSSDSTALSLPGPYRERPTSRASPEPKPSNRVAVPNHGKTRATVKPVNKMTYLKLRFSRQAEKNLWVARKSTQLPEHMSTENAVEVARKRRRTKKRFLHCSSKEGMETLDRRSLGGLDQETDDIAGESDRTSDRMADVDVQSTSPSELSAGTEPATADSFNHPSTAPSLDSFSRQSDSLQQSSMQQTSVQQQSFVKTCTESVPVNSTLVNTPTNTPQQRPRVVGYLISDILKPSESCHRPTDIKSEPTSYVHDAITRLSWLSNDSPKPSAFSHVTNNDVVSGNDQSASVSKIHMPLQNRLPAPSPISSPPGSSIVKTAGKSWTNVTSQATNPAAEQRDVLCRTPSGVGRARFQIYDENISNSSNTSVGSSPKVGIVISHGRAMTLQDKLTGHKLLNVSNTLNSSKTSSPHSVRSPASTISVKPEQTVRDVENRDAERSSSRPPPLKFNQSRADRHSLCPERSDETVRTNSVLSKIDPNLESKPRMFH